MMYVAVATEYRNHAICISPTNAHNWDHIRLKYFQNGGFNCHKAFSGLATWVRRCHQASDGPRLELSHAKPQI
jgi:hypothetical protein